jgi:hypothetical protein
MISFSCCKAIEQQKDVEDEWWYSWANLLQLAFLINARNQPHCLSLAHRRGTESTSASRSLPHKKFIHPKNSSGQKFSLELISYLLLYQVPVNCMYSTRSCNKEAVTKWKPSAGKGCQVNKDRKEAFIDDEDEELKNS